MPGSPAAAARIQHVSELPAYSPPAYSPPAYSPPAHSSAAHGRLVERHCGTGSEMVLGPVTPGGEASRRHHLEKAQAVTALQSEPGVALSDAPDRPRGVTHEVVRSGGWLGRDGFPVAIAGDAP